MEAKTGQILSAAQRAYREIEQQIVTLELAPGSTLTEAALIDAVGFGRTPVREAVQRLAWEGLMEVRPRSGITIAPIRAGDWIKSLEVRMGIEPVLAASAARFGSANATGLLREAGQAMEAAVEKADVKAFLIADKLFDDGLAEASENPFAARVGQPLQSHGRRFWYRYCGEESLAESAGAHIALIEAIVSRDPKRSARQAVLMIELLETYARKLI